MEEVNFTKILPKIELHAHLNGSVSSKTVEKLIRYKQSKDANFTMPKEREFATNGKNKRTLKQIFQMFKILHTLIDNTYSLSMVTRDVIQEFFEDNVYYLELRSTPKNYKEHGMSKSQYIETVLDTIEESTKQLAIIVRFILSIDRRQSIEEAEHTVDLAIKYKQKYPHLVVGVDLSGNPDVGDASVFIPCLLRARSRGLKLTIHVAEVPNCSEAKALLNMKPNRIGHGTCLYPDKGGNMELVNLVLNHKIPIELCLTSNVIGMCVGSYEEHHFKDWLIKNKHPITLSTDDKGIFCSDLSQEYAIVANVFNLTNNQLWQISYNSINYIFDGESTKQKLQLQWSGWKERNHASF